MTNPWTQCPECGCGKGENHRPHCSRWNMPPKTVYHVTEPDNTDWYALAEEAVRMQKQREADNEVDHQ